MRIKNIQVKIEIEEPEDTLNNVQYINPAIKRDCGFDYLYPDPAERTLAIFDLAWANAGKALRREIEKRAVQQAGAPIEELTL